jgi:serine/threonine protein kinase/tetratricopeptide (TPR) repeat protein
VTAADKGNSHRSRSATGHSPGATISHYRIIEKLGEGGMGVVYRAEDTRLKRPVAIKFLPSRVTTDTDARERFLREAQAAASVNHPNICTIHEVDEHDGMVFIVMECVEGEDLRARLRDGPLDPDAAIDIAIQVAEGLAEAHEHGIVHRDIKPGNVMLSPGGRVRIMDFGLARLAAGAELTRPGTTVGTAAYMSPEQIRGRDVDHRADIWSLGAVLYELLTGSKPFQADNEHAMLHAVLSEEPQRPRSLRSDLPQELEVVVLKMLAKDPARRYQTAHEALGALRDAAEPEPRTALRSSVTATPKPTIAVMPFADMSPSGDQQYFCDGVAEEIINVLTQVSGLRVIARTSAFAFRGGDRDIREIGSTLGATSLLEGSVRKAGSRVRITAQLIDVGDGCHVWSERYDRDLEDVFAVQDEIAAAIADRLRVELTPDEEKRLAASRSVDPRAHEAYLRARHYFYEHWHSVWRDREHSSTVIRLFEHAIEIEPGYALAHATLAMILSFLTRWSSAEEYGDRARAMAAKAISLDPLLAEAHTAMGTVLLNADGDWAGAKRDHQRAVELNPGSAEVHCSYGEHLAWEGWYDEAIEEISRAIELDPLDYTTKSSLAFAYHIARRYDDAVAALEEVRRLFPEDKSVDFEQAAERVYARADLPAAAEALEKFFANDLRLAVAYAWMGRREEALRILDWWKEQKVEDVPYRIARIHAALGEKDAALEWLERTFETKPLALLQINSDPELDYLRPDPRFRELMERAGIPMGQLERLSR